MCYIVNAAFSYYFVYSTIITTFIVVHSAHCIVDVKLKHVDGYTKFSLFHSSQPFGNLMTTA